MSIVFSSDEIYTLAMEIEKSGKAFYTAVAKRTDDPDMRDFFNFLAEEEDRHYAYFSRLEKEAPALEIGKEDWEEISEYIRATTDSRFFIGEDRAVQQAKKASGILEAVETAIGFEKDTLLFFYELYQVTPSASKQAAGDIIDEEKRHIRMLSEKRKDLVG
ncbi:MAG: ferritin-like domain-containing protein [Spirochaetia bacterium]